MVKEEKIQAPAGLNVRNDEQGHNWRPHASATRSSFHLPTWINILDIFRACAIVYISCLYKDKKALFQFLFVINECSSY